MEERAKLPKSDKSVDADIKEFGAGVASVMFPMLQTQPNTSFAVDKLAHYTSNPDKSYYEHFRYFPSDLGCRNRLRAS